MSKPMLFPEAGHYDTAVASADGYIALGADASVISSTLAHATVAHSTTGVYTITLTGHYPALKSCQVTLEATTAVALWPQIKSHDVVSAGTIVIHLMNASASLTDPAAGCGLHVSLKFKNNTLGPGK